MFQTNVVENIKTHILCSVTFFFENRSDYEIMWKNIACWIPRATIHALKLCNTHCFSTTTVVARTSSNVTLHVQCLSCYYVVSRSWNLFELWSEMCSEKWSYAYEMWIRSIDRSSFEILTRKFALVHKESDNESQDMEPHFVELVVWGVGLQQLACWNCGFEWAWMSVCCECCVLTSRGICDELITRPEESYRLWCFVVCYLETSWMRRPSPTEDCCAKNKQTINPTDLPSTHSVTHNRCARLFWARYFSTVAMFDTKSGVTSTPKKCGLLHVLLMLLPVAIT